MSRTLVKTNSPTWFVDAANPEGTKVRKRKDDQIFDNLVEAQEALEVIQKAHGSGQPNGQSESAERKPAAKRGANGNRGTEAAKAAVAKNPPKVTTLSTGKKATGDLIEIRCQWKGKDGHSGQRCTNTRLIKPQDQFQVKFCLEHQAEHRRRVRSARAKARRAEARQGKAKTAA